MYETKMPEIYVESNDIVITNSSKEARDSFYKEFSKKSFVE